jgi:hypothetical protein
MLKLAEANRAVEAALAKADELAIHISSASATPTGASLLTSGWTMFSRKLVVRLSARPSPQQG